MLITRESYHQGETTTYVDSIKLTDPHRHKFDSAITEYIYDNMDVWADESSGDAESPTGWFAKAGSKRLILGDERGFVWSCRFDTERARDEEYDYLSDRYYDWDAEVPDDYGFDRHVATMTGTVTFLCRTCNDGVCHMLFDFDAREHWYMHEEAGDHQ